MEMNNINSIIEPQFSRSELEKFNQLNSLNFSYYWKKIDENGNNEDKILLYKSIRVMENLLIYLIDSSNGDEEDSKSEHLFLAYLKIGHLNLLIKDFSKALSAYQRAFTYKGGDWFWKNPSLLFGLGMVYFHFRAHISAGETFSRVLYTYPNLSVSIEAHARLGFVYKTLECFDAALKHFYIALNDTTICSFLSKVEIHFQIGHCYDCAGDLDRACSEYLSLTNNQLIELPKSLHAHILRQLGWICYRQECAPGDRHQKLIEAEGYLIQSRDLEPSCGKTYYYLGRCYSELPERAHDAFANYRHSIDKSEADADTWCSIGVLYQQQTQPMDALQAFACAVQLNGEHSAAWCDLGCLYEVNCQFADASRCFKKALQFRPVAPEALKARIRVLEKELHPSLIGNSRTQLPNKLPGLDEAWKLPIPAELSQRQEEFLKVKHQRYRDGNPLPYHDMQLLMESNNSVSLTIDQLLNILKCNGSEIDLSEQSVSRIAADQGCIVKNGGAAEGNKEEIHAVNALPIVSQDDILSVLRGIKQENDLSGKQDVSPSVVIDSEKGDRLNLAHEIDHSTSVLNIPQSFSLTAKVRVATDISGSELMDRCKRRVEQRCENYEIYDECARPPGEISSSTDKVSIEMLNPQTPLIIIDSRKDAQSFELQNFCYNSTVVLMRGLTSTLRIDLSLFSTKSMVELAPDREIEIKTQYRMPNESNIDHLGNSTWSFYSSCSYSSVKHYAHYQAQSFQYSIREEAEKLRSAGSKYVSVASELCNNTKKRINSGVLEDLAMPMKILKFGSKVDLSDEIKYKVQFSEVHKLPAFCRLISVSNMLTHLGHSVPGMNTLQMCMMVPGARISGRLENNCFACVNINVGPGECEWFAVPHRFWTVINEMLQERGIEFRGSWWPDIEDLESAGIPVYRFIQKAGDVVWIGSGCVYWTQGLGWCNNISWNVGPLTAFQLQIALDLHEWNKLHSNKSLVPMQHLCWQLARNVRFSNRDLYAMIKTILIKSLSYCKMIAEAVVLTGKSLRIHVRQKGELSHYCSVCEIEVWNLLFVRETSGRFPVHCIQCARKAGLHHFTVLQQCAFDDLLVVYDQFRLHPQSKNTIVC